MRRRWLLLAAMALLLVIAAGRLLPERVPHVERAASEGPPRGDAPRHAEANGPVGVPGPATPLAPVAAAPPPTEWWEMSLADNLRAFEAVALGGDMLAAQILGSLLAGCLEAVRDPDGERLRQLFGDQEKTNKQWYERRVAHHADCNATGQAAVLRYHHWLELAARSGNERAMTEYAATALKAFDSHADLLANLDEVIRRRDLARQWLEHALQQGNEQAINILGGAYAGGDLYPRDRSRAMGYALLQQMVIARRIGDMERFDRAWQARDFHWSEGTDAAQQAAALAQARELYDAWFRNRPPP